jgi:hypothetical protein
MSFQYLRTSRSDDFVFAFITNWRLRVSLVWQFEGLINELMLQLIKSFLAFVELEFERLSNFGVLLQKFFPFGVFFHKDDLLGGRRVLVALLAELVELEAERLVLREEHRYSFGVCVPCCFPVFDVLTDQGQIVL